MLTSMLSIWLRSINYASDAGNNNNENPSVPSETEGFQFVDKDSFPIVFQSQRNQRSRRPLIACFPERLSIYAPFFDRLKAFETHTLICGISRLS